MKQLSIIKTVIAAAVAGMAVTSAVQAGGLRETLPDGSQVHVYPTLERDAAMRAERGAARALPVIYHGGGRIMRKVNIYALYWAPPKLQSGAVAIYETNYRTVVNKMLANYAGHSIANVNTQYSEQTGGSTFYHTGLGSFAGVDVASNPFPNRLCNDIVTPNNCLTNSQLRTQIAARMAARGWTPGFDKIYVLFTPKGMGSCLAASSGPSDCAYSSGGYCAYHGHTGSNSNPVIYSNQPYGTAPGGACQKSGIQTPNTPTSADSAATAARHEISEATTDPLLNAWFDANGEETSDKCNFDYGTKTFAGGKANYNWAGTSFLLQREWSNHTSTCVTDGPSGI